MKLNDYLERHDMPAAKLAEAAGVPVSTITRLVRGDRRQPRLDTIQKISAATNGAVSVEDFMPEQDDAA